MRRGALRFRGGVERSAMAGASEPLANPGGLLWGAAGVVLFSMSLPATRIAVGGFDPVFVGASRGAVAGLLALAITLAGQFGNNRPALPSLRDWGQLALVAAGVVLGFPLLTTLAMAKAGAVHGAILTGVLPAATAVAAVALARERPSLGFWLAAGAGLLCVVVFAVVQGAGRPGPADGMLLLAVALCAVGYAAGGVLARRMGGERVIGLALVMSLPITLPLAVLNWDGAGVRAAAWPAWAGFAYVALISQYLGFFAWYRGLAQGGVARVGQLQLAQPVLSMVWAATLLHEAVSGEAAVAAVAVLLCVVLTQRAR